MRPGWTAPPPGCWHACVAEPEVEQAGRRKQTVVFDFGGVLFRWRPAVLIREQLPHRAPDDDTARAWAVRVFAADWGEFDRGTADAPTTADRIAASTGLSPTEVRALIDHVPAELAVMAGTAALLEALYRQGHPLFYLSNMPEPYTDHVSRAPFFGRFRDGVFSSHVKQIKPEADIFVLAQQQFGLSQEDAADTVFIDDMPANVAAARAHGWQAVQFVDALQCERDLRSLGCLAG